MFSNCNDFNHDVFKLQITMFQIAMPSTTMFQMANANGKWQMQMANCKLQCSKLQCLQTQCFKSQMAKWQTTIFLNCQDFKWLKPAYPPNPFCLDARPTPDRQSSQSIRSFEFSSTAMLLFLAGKLLLISLLIVADRLLLYLSLVLYLFLYLSVHLSAFWNGSSVLLKTMFQVSIFIRIFPMNTICLWKSYFILEILFNLSKSRRQK